MSQINGCECKACQVLPDGLGHRSDCSVHNEPAYPNELCDCDPSGSTTTEDDDGIHDWCNPERGLHGSQCTVPETIRIAEHQRGITTEDTDAD